LPVCSFQTLLADLATIVKNRIRIQFPELDEIAVKILERITRPTPLQQKAFDLLGVRL
jgi:hypothetical protein